MGNVKHINRDIFAKCSCGSFDWNIIVDKPDFEVLVDFQCAECKIKINIIKIKRRHALKHKCPACGENTTWVAGTNRGA